jgi:hypothetical protein
MRDGTSPSANRPATITVKNSLLIRVKSRATARRQVEVSRTAVVENDPRNDGPRQKNGAFIICRLPFSTSQGRHRHPVDKEIAEPLRTTLFSRRIYYAQISIKIELESLKAIGQSLTDRFQRRFLETPELQECS